MKIKGKGKVHHDKKTKKQVGNSKPKVEIVKTQKGGVMIIRRP